MKKLIGHVRAAVEKYQMIEEGDRIAVGVSGGDKIKAGLEVLAQSGHIRPPKKYFLGSDLYDELEDMQANPVPFGGNDYFQPLGDGVSERFF